MYDYKFSEPIRIGNHVFIGLIGDTRPIAGPPVFDKFHLVDEHGRQWNRDEVDAIR